MDSGAGGGGGSLLGGGAGGGSGGGSGGGLGGGTGGGGSIDAGLTFSRNVDAGSISLSGAIGFPFVDGIAGFASTRAGLTVVVHDYAASTGCASSIPNTATAKVLQFRAYNPDGGDLMAGAYPFGDVQTATTPVADLTLSEYTPLGMTSFGGVAVSGTLTLSTVATARVSGTLQGQLRSFEDGGLSNFSSNFDLATCN
jgi:hypothetical protein